MSKKLRTRENRRQRDQRACQAMRRQQGDRRLATRSPSTISRHVALGAGPLFQGGFQVEQGSSRPGRKPGLFTPVCHCLPQGKQCARLADSTSSAKQWHTADANIRGMNHPGKARCPLRAPCSEGPSLVPARRRRSPAPIALRLAAGLARRFVNRIVRQPRATRAQNVRS